MDLTNLYGGIYKNITVLITGDTGFKGSWLVIWLLKMEAKVIGFSLDPHTEFNHFTLLGENYTSIRGNINNPKDLDDAFNKHQPEIVFHLAAQSLVRYGYENPIETLQTNIIGTANVFEVSRKTASVRAVVNITSDKCYENKEWLWGYRENDPMGGHDPYSVSKGCAELITASYQKSFFNTKDKLLASARAGNVIGGGDWAQDRLIPDMVTSAGNNEIVSIRNPLATRPWQHVLDPLSGYLMLGWRLLEGKVDYAEGWNFGPDLNSNVTVETLLEKASGFWNKIEYQISKNNSDYHEANLLMLDCSKATKRLKWTPVWGFDDTVKKTIEWYRNFYNNSTLNTNKDLEDFIQSAKDKSLLWTK